MLSIQKSMLALMLTGSTILANTEQAATQLNATLTEITNLHLAGSSNHKTAVTPKKPFSERTFSEKSLWEIVTKEEEPTFTLANFSNHERMSIAYQLMTPELNQLPDTLLSPRAFKDLEMLLGANKKEISLVELLNRTHLAESKVFLGALLTHPTTDIQILKNRQSIVRTLVENPKLTENLDAIFKKLQTNHDTALSFWSSTEEATKKFTSRQYYGISGLKWLNTNKTYQHITTGVQTALYPLLGIGGSALAQYGILEQFTPQHVRNNPQLVVNFFKENPAALGGFALIEAYFGLVCAMAYNQCQLTVKALAFLHEKSIALADIITAVDILEQQLRDYPQLQTLQYAGIISDFAHTKKSLSEKMQRLVELLRTNTFKSKPTFFALQGRVRVAYALIEELKNEFIPVLIALAEIDAYLSCATLYKAHQDGTNAYCFATYLEQDTPYLNAQAMWNPFVGAEKSVVNSIELGAHLPLNIILTGPNAGGKSTFSKGIALSVILAQTITITPGKTTLTPFAKINTYMNISDDTAGGNSLFKSEVMRAQELLNSIIALPKNQFSFSVMDEMFSGTSPKEGEAAGYAVAKNIGSHKNSIAIIATHFPRLKKLDTDTGNFKNYQVRVIRHEDGTFSYPFKLEEGAADQNVALDILANEGFESSILTDAHAIMNESAAA